MKNYFVVMTTTLLLIFFTAGCNDKRVKEIIRDANIDGTWTAPAYGISAVLNDDEITLYQYTSDYCQQWDYDINYKEFVDSSSMSSDLDTITVTFADLKQPGLKMTRENSLPGSCANDLIAQHGDSGYQFSPQQDLDIFWQTFNEYYAFFEIEDVDWDAVYAQADVLVDSNTTEAELFEVLSEMIEPLKDFHSFLYSESLEEIFSVSRKPELSDIALQEFIDLNNITGELTDEQLVAFEIYFEAQIEITLDTIVGFSEDPDLVESNDSETIFWAMLNDNIGYVLLTSMDAEELGIESNSVAENIELVDQTFDTILETFEGSDGIIIDVRMNEGGDDFIGRMLTSRLINRDLYVYSKQARLGASRTPAQRVTIKPNRGKLFLGPVVALTSATTSSAAETFALTIRARDNTQLIGEATGGGLSDILPKSLPHGLQFGLSNEIYISSDGMEFEGVGVPVDQAHDFFTLEQRQSNTDLGLTAAIGWIGSQQ